MGIVKGCGQGVTGRGGGVSDCGGDAHGARARRGGNARYGGNAPCARCARYSRYARCEDALCEGGAREGRGWNEERREGESAHHWREWTCVGWGGRQHLCFRCLVCKNQVSDRKKKEKKRKIGKSKKKKKSYDDPRLSQGSDLVDPTSFTELVSIKNKKIKK